VSSFHRFFSATLQARRSNRLSLTDSYRLALDIAKLPKDGDEHYVQVQSVIHQLLGLMEQDGRQQAKIGIEPAYHNRQHVADAVLSMSCFLGEEAQFSINEKKLLLLVMLVHDYGHCGMNHQKAGLSHEQESIQLLSQSPMMLLPSADITFVNDCILGTSPDQVGLVVNQYRSNPNDRFAFMRALVNDADIATSYIDPLGLELSKLILQERGNPSPGDEEVKSVLDAFRKSAVISTPVALEALGLN
jgi:hypothetical protein